MIKFIVTYIMENFLDESAFKTKFTTAVAYTVSIILFISFLVILYLSLEYKNNAIETTKISWLSIILLATVFTILFFKIKYLYNNPKNLELNETLEIFLKTIFTDVNTKTSKKRLLANYYKLSTFLKVIKNDNKSYIVFGKIDKETYWSIYTQFCTLSSRVMWTKNTSLMNKKELKNILDRYAIEHNDHDICKKIQQHQNKNLTTTYDAEFLKANGIKDRIFVVDKIPDNLTLKTYDDFLKLIQTEDDVVISKDFNSHVKVKRIKDFIGDSNIYVINKEELKMACGITLHGDIREFGVYEIDNTLYTLKTRVSGDEWYVTIEVESADRNENKYNNFFKKYRNKKKLATYQIGGTPIKIYHIKEVA